MKDTSITIRVPENVKMYLELIAKQENQTLSQYLRKRLVNDIISFRELTEYAFDEEAGLEV